MVRKKSVCYVNATVLPRRPISELIALEAKRRKVGLLIPSMSGHVHDTTLHHANLLSKADVRTYRTFRMPGPFEWPLPGLGFPIQAWRVLRDYDVVHIWAHFYPSNVLLLIMSLFFPRKKVILTVDTLPGYSFNAGTIINFLFKAYTLFFRQIIFGIPSVVTLYGDALVPHARRSGINAEKLRVLPTGISGKQLPKSSARKWLETELKLPRHAKIVVYAGLLNPRKRVETVIDVAQAFPSTVFIIAGDGPLRAKLEQRAEGKGVCNVRFLGWRQDIQRILAGADALLFPSSAEGLPGIVMEAMLQGTPVLTTAIPCTTDLISEGKEGLLCPVGDIACFRKKLGLLLTDGRLHGRISRQAKKKIERFSWGKIRPKYEKLYGD